MLKSILTASFGIIFAVTQIASGEDKTSVTTGTPAAKAISENHTETTKVPATKPSEKTQQKKQESKKSTAAAESHDHKKERRQASAHNHGSSRFDVLVVGKNLTISGAIPLMDLIGFERVPKTDDEKTSLSNIFQIFRQGSIIQPAETGCTMTKMEAKVEPPFMATPRNRRSKNSSPAETHHAIEFDMAWQCPLEVAKLKVGVFDTYPGVNTINIQFINQAKQGSISLKRADKITEIELR